MRSDHSIIRDRHHSKDSAHYEGSIHHLCSKQPVRGNIENAVEEKESSNDVHHHGERRDYQMQDYADVENSPLIAHVTFTLTIRNEPLGGIRQG